MNETYSQINIYEKEEYENAFPLQLQFIIDLNNSLEENKTSTEVSEFVKNKLSMIRIILLNKNNNLANCLP
jgi:hypothetical protein